MTSDRHTGNRHTGSRHTGNRHSDSRRGGVSKRGRARSREDTDADVRPEVAAASRGVASEEALLDAARSCLLAVGWRRTTLTDVARRAGVSRMTIYRRWPDMQTLMSDLMTREWTAIGASSALLVADESSPARRISRGVVETVQALRANPLFQKIVDVDPELLLTYLLQRRGRTQDVLLDLLVEQVVAAQETGSLRTGDAQAIARSVVLAAQGFAVSAGIMADKVDEDALAEELRILLEGYLSP
ncbi:MAG: TetR/AcrR family transcriptional regulator [Nocardioidaceae bacterium]